MDSPGIESRWGSRFSAPVQTGPGANAPSCTMGTASFLGVKSGRGVTLTPQPLLMPWSRKSRAISLLPLWAIRPVQSLSACTRVHFTFFTFMVKYVISVVCNFRCDTRHTINTKKDDVTQVFHPYVYPTWVQVC